jgi:hypothetical protein
MKKSCPQRINSAPWGRPLQFGNLCYRPISLLDAFGDAFEISLLTRVLREVNELLVRDDQFGFEPRFMTPQLAGIFERFNITFD